MNIPLAEASHIIVAVWGKGFQCIHTACSSYEDALTKVTKRVSIYNKQYKRSNVPTFFIFEKKAFMACIPKPNKPKRIPNKRIPKGVLTMSD